MVGDTMIKFNYHGSLAIEDLFRVQFNPAFIGNSNVLELNLKELCPENIHKKKSIFPEDFKVQFIFENENCEAGCRSDKTTVDQICDSCVNKMDYEYFAWL